MYSRFGSSVFVEHIPTREQLDAENRAVPFYNETLRHYSRMWYADLLFLPMNSSF